ncbi:flavin reductase family protein [Govanella unica]|uniref:Flavin reductase family protein n=1 Tax=Govanella unica TaxID=2975056 RepID=A0A9X3Z8A4_9PROT|nr:flavin reductase family protein [Govania unica]MDA5195032.1 flavin reductase family protein [Govania unica]
MSASGEYLMFYRSFGGPKMTVSIDCFKRGMRQLASGVSVVTSRFEDNLAGMTVTAVASLSAEPPKLLVCLNRAGQTFDMVRQSRIMCVNILSAEQTELAAAFARSSENKFAGCDWDIAKTGAPIIREAAVSFDCRIDNIIDAGTHGIVIGEILDIIIAEEANCLVYKNGQYGTLMMKTG